MAPSCEDHHQRSASSDGINFLEGSETGTRGVARNASSSPKWARADCARSSAGPPCPAWSLRGSGRRWKTNCWTLGSCCWGPGGSNDSSFSGRRGPSRSSCFPPAASNRFPTVPRNGPRSLLAAPNSAPDLGSLRSTRCGTDPGPAHQITIEIDQLFWLDKKITRTLLRLPMTI